MDRFEDRLAPDAGLDRPHHPFEVFIDATEKDILLGFEVAEESAGGDIRLFSDSRNRDPLEALLTIEAHGGFDQGLTGFLLLSFSQPFVGPLHREGLKRAIILHYCKYA